MWWLVLAVIANDGGVLLNGPSAAVYDPATDSVLVSNVNGPPWLRDNNGFITEIASDGGVLSARWVKGGDAKVTLHAPRGLAVIEGRLFVADIDTVRVFDRKTHAPVQEVKVLGASSIEGLVAFGSRLYLVDSGWRALADGGVEATGTDGLYAIETRAAKPVLKTLAKSRGLQHPRGLAVTPTTLYVTSSTEPVMFTFDLAGHVRSTGTSLPYVASGGLFVKETELFVFTTAGVLRGKIAGDEWQSVSGEVASPGLMGVDEAGSRAWLPSVSRGELTEVTW